MTRPNRALLPLRRSLRGRVRHPSEVAAVILATAVVARKYPRRRGRAKGGGIVRVSRSTGRTTVIAPRNAVLSWTRLFTTVAKAVSSVRNTPLDPVSLSLAGLVIVGSFGELVTRELSERHGAVIYVMWRRHGHVISQRTEILKPEVNRELRRLGKPPMKLRELEDTLRVLSEYGCIVATPLRWRLKDTVWLTL
jgi:hypothetical protein